MYRVEIEVEVQAEIEFEKYFSWSIVEYSTVEQSECIIRS